MPSRSILRVHPGPVTPFPRAAFKPSRAPAGGRSRLGGQARRLPLFCRGKPIARRCASGGQPARARWLARRPSSRPASSRAPASSRWCCWPPPAAAGDQVRPLQSAPPGQPATAPPPPPLAPPPLHPRPRALLLNWRVLCLPMCRLPDGAAAAPGGQAAAAGRVAAARPAPASCAGALAGAAAATARALHAMPCSMLNAPSPCIAGVHAHPPPAVPLAPCSGRRRRRRRSRRSGTQRRRGIQWTSRTQRCK